MVNDAGGSAGAPGEAAEWLYLTTRSEAELAPILTAYGQLVGRMSEVADPFGALAHQLRVYLIDSATGGVRRMLEHPEWLMRNPDGSHFGSSFDFGFYEYLCVNTPYRDFLMELVTDLFETTPVDAYPAALDLNLMSVVAMCKAAVPPMRERGWGRVVAITSVSVRQPIANLILSNTARAGATGFLKTLALEVAGDGVTVNRGGASGMGGWFAVTGEGGSSREFPIKN